MSTADIQSTILHLLHSIGENPDREGLRDTPSRVARYYAEVLSGYEQDPFAHSTTFPSEGHNMVVVKDINFYSLCEHHMVPFFGAVSIAYIPNEKILGLSKFGRIVEVYAKRLQVQERLTNEVLQAVTDILDPLGCAVKIEAKHLCMAMRGIKQDDAMTQTTAFYGDLEKNDSLRKEFLATVS